jgi:hypothetical protein
MSVLALRLGELARCESITVRDDLIKRDNRDGEKGRSTVSRVDTMLARQLHIVEQPVATTTKSRRCRLSPQHEGL